MLRYGRELRRSEYLPIVAKRLRHRQGNRFRVSELPVARSAA